MTVQITASEGGIPHNTVMAIGLVGSLVCLYLTFGNQYLSAPYLSFFGGFAAVLAIWWGTDTIKHLCSYGLGTGVPSAGMLALGSGVIAMLLATKINIAGGYAIPVITVVIAAILGIVLGFVADKVINMNIPVMMVSIAELCVVGAISMLGYTACVGGSISFVALGMDNLVLASGVLATIFMLGGIALQHAFNACLGPNESQDRTLMLAAECGFLSMITVAIMSVAFVPFKVAFLTIVIAAICWFYTYKKYIELSKRDAFMWLDAKPIREVGGE